tara:strand:+ start:486 stop:1136 length:651 start_codon:yes stop_codon:yes gene_type:complete
MNKVSKNNFEYKKDIENDNIREKIKVIIKRDKKYNLRDLSRTLKKNDAYLQQYLFRGTPKILPEEYRHRLAEILNVNITELTPNWLKKFTPEEKLITIKNIETDSLDNNYISISQKLLFDSDFSKLENLFFFQTNTDKGMVTTIVDVGINKYTKPDLYLLHDKNNFFLAYIKISEVNNTKMSIKPYLETFYPFHISSEILKVSGKALWQGSKIFLK